MTKFSIIVPVLNVEDYIKKCLDSIVNQTFFDFECILICDDSRDNSEYIANEYAKNDKRLKVIHKSKTGLSEARNLGVEASSGQYLLFLDSDDYYEKDLLKTLNNTIDNQDLVRFQVREICKNQSIDWNEKECNGSGIDCFNTIVKFHYIENAWAYCYKSSFYKVNNFKFMKNCIAEDFGLIPLIIAKSAKMSVISFIGYIYVQRANSLMNNNDYKRKIIKMNDMIKQSEYLNCELLKINNSKIFLSFIYNSLIYYSTKLNYVDFKKYKSYFKFAEVYKYLSKDSLYRKIKFILIKWNAYYFYNLLRLK